MKITNKYNLPEAFVKIAEQNEEIKEGEYRVTQLLNGLRASELLRRYSDKITVDVSDMIWMLYGTAVHKALEMTEEESDEFREERLKMTVGGLTLTGKSDVFKDGIITDWKTTSVWKIIHGDYEDWKKQLGLYYLLWDNAGFEVKSAKIVAIMRDHSKMKALTDKTYPIFPVETIEFKFTKEYLDELYDWAITRMHILKSLEKVPDTLLPMCTQKERMNDGNKYAVMKKGQKRAKRVFDTRNEADQYLRENGGDYVEERPGEDRKCLYYCMARSVCPYAKKLIGYSEGGEDYEV